jgi:hypothetical protein
MTELEEPQTNRERLSKVFEFLKAYVELRNPPVRDIQQEFRHLWLRDIPEHPSVDVIRGEVDPDQDSENADIVLRITRPELHDCPPLPKAIAGWVTPGWDAVDGGGEILASRWWESGWPEVGEHHILHISAIAPL